MDILYLLIPISLLLVGLIAWILLWAVRSGQFEDMEGPAQSVIMDDDTPHDTPKENGVGCTEKREVLPKNP
jgi:cbb3-type cytochrome oxidase maturation protein